MRRARGAWRGAVVTCRARRRGVDINRQDRQPHSRLLQSERRKKSRTYSEKKSAGRLQDQGDGHKRPKHGLRLSWSTESVS